MRTIFSKILPFFTKIYFSNSTLVLISALNIFILAFFFYRCPIIIFTSTVFKLNVAILIALHTYYGIMTFLKDYSSNDVFNLFVACVLSFCCTAFFLTYVQ
jgi:membrane protein YdbS with pleckstrin-like domain